ncbi:MAG: 2-oxoglutarate ferredoxin oxidoreductase subunit alpha, partial [Chloroflexota bacterium]
LWPFADELFKHATKYLSVELNYDGQLVREVQRAVSKGSQVHFYGKCGELPTVAELLAVIEDLLAGRPIHASNWKWEAW